MIGHHFVKVQADGTIIEKNGNEPVKMFSGWSPRLNGCPEAIFAVKKDHSMDLQRTSICIRGIEGMNFEETVKLSIQEHSNSFKYHNHEFYFKKDNDGNIYICSEGRIIADIFIENSECLVDVLEAEKRYVSNTQPPVHLHIRDGKLQINEDIEK